MTKGERSKRQLYNSLRWPIYIFNLVDITKFREFCQPSQCLVEAIYTLDHESIIVKQFFS